MQLVYFLTDCLVYRMSKKPWPFFIFSVTLKKVPVEVERVQIHRLVGRTAVTHLSVHHTSSKRKLYVDGLDIKLDSDPAFVKPDIR